MSEVVQRVIDIVNGRAPSAPKEMVALEPDQIVITMPEGMERPDAVARAEEYKVLLESEVISVNDVRAREGFPPSANKPYIRFRMQPGDDGAIVPRSTVEQFYFRQAKVTPRVVL